ncbi:PD40 domain-containing protein [Cohnella cholangitidis]|uniref:Translocation protein TolB n=1 Tax=Cohnella cholangitidis TaxID=2598458 RepID=A0A7G5BY61_9BACL|nr:PD40 domain-containing protein [Cohnella cholangitidis]QMV41895.1 translocation protein TolB [Cohnella cholangitidis]
MMRLIRKLGWIMVAVALLAGLGYPAIAEAKPKDSLKAAFVRGGDLWAKAGKDERQLTKGEAVRNPKWSFDGEWIAYSSGEGQQELKLLEVSTGKSQLVASTGGNNFQWSPDHNRLAFLQGQKLVWVSVNKPDRQTEVSDGIGNYSWLPDGKGFIASSAAELLPDGWTPVKIVEIPLAGQGDPSKVKTLFVLPKQSNDFFAVGTSIFKFSSSGKWIAFLATPTASLSADGNTLCLLSSDGSVFKKVDQMANNNEWFNWADRGDKLAYIGGVGREATSNKQLKVLEAPDGKAASYTPAGYVDQSFTWEGEQRVVVSRTKEWKGSAGGSGTANKPLPNLVEIKLQGPRFKPLTQPPAKYGDFNPQFLAYANQLGWVRSDRTRSDVLVAGRGGKHPLVWIKNIDAGANFYEQWKWSEVLSFYDRTTR